MRITSVSSIGRIQNIPASTNNNDIKNQVSFFGRKTDEANFSNLYNTNVTTPIDTAANTLNIVANNAYSLGTVNGKPLNFNFSNSGLIETNFSPRISASQPGSQVSAYDKETANMFSSFSLDEHKQENELVGRLIDLIDVSQGKISVDDFNSRGSSAYLSSTEELLKQLKVDTNRPFIINGVKLNFKDGIISKA